MNDNQFELLQTRREEHEIRDKEQTERITGLRYDVERLTKALASADMNLDEYAGLYYAERQDREAAEAEIARQADQIEDLQERNTKQAEWLNADSEDDAATITLIEDLEAQIEDHLYKIAGLQASVKYANEQRADAVSQVNELERINADQLTRLRECEAVGQSRSEEIDRLHGDLDKLYVAYRERGQELHDADEALELAADAITTHWHDARDAQAEVYRLMQEAEAEAKAKAGWREAAQHWFARCEEMALGGQG